jgi:ribosomal protein S26
MEGEPMAKKLGIVEPCPEQTSLCAGHFKRGSAAQVRCNECTKWLKNHKAKLYQRERRENPVHPDVVANIKEMDSLDKSKGYSVHPCWCCGQPTKRQALCDVCFENGGKHNHGSEGTCAINRRKLEQVEQRLRALLAEKVKVYTSKDMTQEQLELLVPSNGT